MGESGVCWHVLSGVFCVSEWYVIVCALVKVVLPSWCAVFEMTMFMELKRRKKNIEHHHSKPNAIFFSLFC